MVHDDSSQLTGSKNKHVEINDGRLFTSVHGLLHDGHLLTMGLFKQNTIFLILIPTGLLLHFCPFVACFVIIFRILFQGFNVFFSISSLVFFF
jgi:hypothetical protein